MVFNKFNKLQSGKQIFLAIVIAFAVISFWRGIWGILDIYLFPDQLELSMWASMIVGLLILIATHYTIKELT